MDIIEFGQQQAAQLQSFADSFLKSVGAVQQQFFDKLNSLVSHLERDGELILANETNGKIVDEINNVLGAMLSESGYETAIVDFVSTFDKQKQLIDDYLSTQFDGTQNDFADAVFEQTKKSAIETLSSATPTTKFLQGIKSQIEIAVQSGSSFTKTVKDLRLYATGGLIDAGAQISGKDTPGVDGKLLQYSKQIAYDSIAISDRAYTNAIASGIDAEWYFFAGGILPSSRKFCIDRVGKYFHYKEIEDWANKEWQGKTENTNEQNIFILLGGHNCQHTLIPVSIDQVPTDVVQRNISNGNYKPGKDNLKGKKKEPEPKPKQQSQPKPKQPPPPPPPPPQKSSIDSSSNIESNLYKGFKRFELNSQQAYSDAQKFMANSVDDRIKILDINNIKGLTGTFSSLEEYKSSGYAEINNYLLNSERLTSEGVKYSNSDLYKTVRKKSENIENVIKQIKISENVVMFRGYTDMDLWKSLEYLNENNLMNDAVGTTTIDRSFKSMSLNKEISEQFIKWNMPNKTETKGGILLEVLVPKGTNAVALENLSQAKHELFTYTSSEMEFVLNHNTKFEFIGFEKIILNKGGGKEFPVWKILAKIVN